MLYLNKNDLNQIGAPWEDTIDNIEQTVEVIKQNNFSQPLKPYLDFKEPKNRIIAMPARVGSGLKSVSGIKWIASFPENTKKNKTRANSVTILNSSSTGEPFAIINSSLVSALRTASVTGYMLRRYFSATHKKGQRVLIIGFGPIGHHHLSMLLSQYQDYLDIIEVFDLRVPDLSTFQHNHENVQVSKNLQASFEQADIVITCTTSSVGYLDFPPKKNSLHLNVSLRDYTPNMQQYFDTIIVDSWTEVCRAGTDIESMHKINHLQSSECIEIQNITDSSLVNKTVFFNPMGMATFDISIANLIVKKAESLSLGLTLE